MTTTINWKLPSGQSVALRPLVVAGGIDFGFSHPTVLEIGFKLGHNLWLNGVEWYQTNADSRTILASVALATKKYGVQRWWADSEDPREITNLQKHGLPVMANEIHELDYGLRVIYGLLARQVVHPVLGRGPAFRVASTACPNLVREFGLYGHRSVKGEYRTDLPPMDRFDDCISACRYYLTNEGEMPPEELVQSPRERPKMHVNDKGQWVDDPEATIVQTRGPVQEGWWDEQAGGQAELAVTDVDI
jgi:hypothetical protein